MGRLFGVIVLFLILFSCREEENKVKKVTLVSSVSEVSDTLFFANVENLVASGNDIFLIDKHRNRIVSLNSNDWTLKSLIGVYGEGPNELCNLSQFSLKDDTLYALDGGCGKLVTYDLKGNICSKYQLPLESKLMTGYRFLINEYRKMNISTHSGSGAFVELDLLDSKISFWGERSHFNYTSQDIIRNGRNLYKTMEGYVMVSDNMPQIERYNNQKERIDAYDYSNIPIVRDRLLHIDREKLNTNSYGIVCEDSYMYNNKLYLLLVSNESNDFTVNKIAVFTLFPQIKFDVLLEMPGNIYSTICVSNDKIFAFECRRNRLEALQM